MPKNRFWDAWCIQQGACNPSGIAHSLLDAIAEARQECSDTKSVCADPAVRMIAHQLAYILNLAEYDNSLTAYGRDLDICRDKAQAE